MHATSAGNLSELRILLCSIHNKPASVLIVLFALCRYQKVAHSALLVCRKMQSEGTFAQVKTIATGLPDCHLLPPEGASDTHVWTFSSILSVSRDAFVCSPHYLLVQVLHKEATALPKASSQGGVRTCKTLCSLPCLAVRATDYFRQFFWGTPRSFYNPLDQIKIHYQGSILIYISYWRKIKKSGRKIRKDRTPYLRRGPPA
jgi:hypothetical protein